MTDIARYQGASGALIALHHNEFARAAALPATSSAGMLSGVAGIGRDRPWHLVPPLRTRSGRATRATGIVDPMSLVTCERRGHVAVITLNRPEARNAINPEMARAIGGAVDQLEDDPDLRVGVLAATVTEPRPVFCAGDDLRAIEGEPAMTEKGHFAGFVRYPRRKPIVAAVDGLATSGGCEIVLACDLVVATTRSSFALAEVKWSLAPLAGGAFRLPRLIGRAAALDMILTGQALSAERAYQLGIVSTLTKGDAVEAAVERAQLIADHDPETVSTNLELANRALTMGEDELWAANAEFTERIFSSPTFKSGLAAFDNRKS